MRQLLTTILCSLWLCATRIGFSSGKALHSKHANENGYRKKLIIDTDMMNFVDDPMAIGLANIFQEWNKVEILGVMSSISSRYAPPAINAINTFYGHGKIPVAAQKPVDNSTSDCNYLTGLTFHFPEDIHDGSNTTDPVTIYRNLLARSPDNSVTVAAIGFFDNLFHLTLSGPDYNTPLSGKELLKRKVTELVVMGNEVGDSFNLIQHNVSFAATVLNGWEGNLTFVPETLGDMTYLGRRLTTETSPENPVAYAFDTCVGYNKNHQSWDVTMYYAICGLHPAFKLVHDHGIVHISTNGSASWDNSYKEIHSQNALKLFIDNKTFASELDGILAWEPEKRRPKGPGNIITRAGFEVRIHTIQSLLRLEPDTLKRARHLYAEYTAGLFTVGGKQSHEFMPILDFTSEEGRKKQAELLKMYLLKLKKNNHDMVHSIIKTSNEYFVAWFMFLAHANIHNVGKSFETTTHPTLFSFGMHPHSRYEHQIRHRPKIILKWHGLELQNLI